MAQCHRPHTRFLRFAVPLPFRLYDTNQDSLPPGGSSPLADWEFRPRVTLKVSRHYLTFLLLEPFWTQPLPPYRTCASPISVRRRAVVRKTVQCRAEVREYGNGETSFAITTLSHIASRPSVCIGVQWYARLCNAVQKPANMVRAKHLSPLPPYRTLPLAHQCA